MLTAIIIIEMMGRPPEHLKTNIEEHVGKLDSVNGVKVIKKTFNEPKEIKVDEKEKENKGLFTCFSEIEFECESLEQLANIMFDFMPASIEVVEPSTVSLSSDEATGFMNNLTGRLHRYDEVVKIMQNREKQLAHKFGVAQKLLYGHGIIDKEGKILKIPENLKKKLEEKKEIDKKKEEKVGKDKEGTKKEKSDKKDNSKNKSKE